MSKITPILLFMLFVTCNAQVKPNDISLREEVKNYTLELIVSGIQIPWGMTWLPDGTMLVTEKSGILYQIKSGIKTEIKNVPKVYNRGQGGLLDIVLHPDWICDFLFLCKRKRNRHETPIGTSRFFAKEK